MRYTAGLSAEFNGAYLDGREAFADFKTREYTRMSVCPYSGERATYWWNGFRDAEDADELADLENS